MGVGDIPKIELAACEAMCGVSDAFCDGTDGESVVVGIGVGNIQLALSWNAVRGVQLMRALVQVNGNRSGAS